MPLILAIEPDRRQANQLNAVVKSRLHADFVLAETAERALAAIGDRVPDLILTSALLSRTDEVVLGERLRALNGAAAHVQTLTIPVLADPRQRSKRSGGMLSALRFSKAKEDDAPDGCDPTVFASQCEEYLERAAAELAMNRAASDRQAEAFGETEKPIAVAAAQESMAAAAPARDEFEWTAAMSEPAEPVREEFGATSEPIAPVREVFGTTSEPVEPVSEWAGAASSSFEPIREEFGTTSEPVEPIREWAGAASSSFEPISEEFRTPTEPVEPVRESASASTEPVETLQEAASPATEAVEPAGTWRGAMSEVFGRRRKRDDAASDPVEPIRAWVGAMSDQAEPSRESVGASSESVQPIREELEAVDEPVVPVVPIVPDVPEVPVRPVRRPIQSAMPVTIDAFAATATVQSAIAQIEAFVAREALADETIAKIEADQTADDVVESDPPDNFVDLDLSRLLEEAAAAESASENDLREWGVDGSASTSKDDEPLVYDLNVSGDDSLINALFGKLRSFGRKKRDEPVARDKRDEPVGRKKRDEWREADRQPAPRPVDVEAPVPVALPPKERERWTPARLGVSQLWPAMAMECVAVERPSADEREQHHRMMMSAHTPSPRAQSRHKPIQDEWGFFDPEQCGFAALLAKLDEILETDDRPA